MDKVLETITRNSHDAYVRTRMSHNGSEEYFNSIGIKRSNYVPTHLSVTLIELPSQDFSFHAELLLANKALSEKCEYVTNLDYCQADYEHGRLILAGTGWKPR